MKRVIDFLLGALFIVALVAAFLYGKHRADARWVEFVDQYCPSTEESTDYEESYWDYSQYSFIGDL